MLSPIDSTVFSKREFNDMQFQPYHVMYKLIQMCHWIGTFFFVVLSGTVCIVSFSVLPVSHAVSKKKSYLKWECCIWVNLQKPLVYIRPSQRVLSFIMWWILFPLQLSYIFDFYTRKLQRCAKTAPMLRNSWFNCFIVTCVIVVLLSPSSNKDLGLI